MARIPIGNFGNVIAQPAPAVRMPAAAFDGGGSGAQKLGDTAIQVAAGMREDERQQAEHIRQQETALTRARAANAILDREIAVDTIGKDIEQQVSTGQLHYSEAPAKYKERLNDLGTPSMTGMDAVTAENFSKGVKRADFKGEGVIGGIVGKARQVDFRTQTDGLLDKLGKQAGMPGADMAKINAQADALDDIGRQAYGAAWGKKKQDWIDNNWDAQLNQQAMAVVNDLNGIVALQMQISIGPYADKLDSNRRNTLVAKLEGYRSSLITRQEAAAARAERAHERYLKKAEATFNTFQVLADKGTVMNPAYVDQVVQLTAGTPYQQGVVALTQQAQENGGLAMQPLRTQEALLIKIDTQIAQQGRTPALDKRREQIAKVLAASQTDLKENGLRAGLERGVITHMAPLDTRNPAAMIATMTERLQQAEAVSQWAGKPVSPLDSAEADTLRGMLETLPYKQKSQAVATLAAAVGPQAAAAIARQIDAKDKPLALAFAHADAKTSLGRHTSELILKGAAAIKDGAVMKDDKKVTGWRAIIAEEVNDAFPDEKLATAVKESAYYVAAGIAQENGGSVSPSDVRRAVRLAIGGNVIERNGKKLPTLGDMDADEFDRRLRMVSPGDIQRQAPDGKVRVAGQEMSVADFHKSIPGQELIYAGPGRYAVIVKGRPVINSANQPVIIGVK